MQVGSVHATIGADLSPLQRGIRQANVELGGFAKNLGGITPVVGRVQGVLGTLGIGFAGFKIGGLVRDSALLSARFQTLGVVMGVVGRNAGYNGAQMSFFEAGLRKSGIAAVEARATLSRMAQAQIDLAKSSDLARVAQDAAVIGGINSSEAFERMVHGIQSAEVEILRTIGINVSFEDSYQKLAKQLGVSTTALTEQQKTQARVNAVLEAGGRIAGSYEASLGTAGKQMGSMKRLADDLKVKLGGVFDASLNAAVFGFSDALKDAQKAVDKIGTAQIQSWGRSIADAGEALGRGAFYGGVATALVQVGKLSSGFIQNAAATRLATQARTEYTFQQLADAAAAHEVARGRVASANAALQEAKQTAALTGNKQIEAQARAQLSAAVKAETASKAALIAMDARHTASMARTTAAAGLAARAMTGLKAAGAALVSPWGIAITTAGLLATAFYNSGKAAREAAKDTDKYKESLAGLNEVQLQMRKASLEQQRFEAERELATTSQLSGFDLSLPTETGSVNAGRKPNPRFKQLSTEVSVLQGQIEQVDDMLAQLGTGTGTTGGGTGGETALDVLQKKGKLLLGLYDELKARGANTAPVLSAMRALQSEAEAIYRGQNGALTETAAGALELSNQLREVLKNATNLWKALDQVELKVASVGDPVANMLKRRKEEIGGGPEAQIYRNGVQISGPLAARAQAGMIRTPMGTPREAPSRGLQMGAAWGLARQGKLGDAGAALGAPKGVGDALGMAAGGAMKLAAAFNPLGILATVFGKALESLAPALEPLVNVVGRVGGILGKALLPVLEASWPVFKLTTIAATYLGQVLFNVAGGILNAVGWLVRGIGKLVNLLPGSPGDPLVKAGQAMIDMGKGFLEGAGALATARDEIKGLDWDSATAPLKDAAREAASSLNVATGFRVQRAAFEASAARALPAPSSSSTGAGSPAPVTHINVTAPIPPETRNPREAYATWHKGFIEAARAAGADVEALLYAMPVPTR